MKRSNKTLQMIAQIENDKKLGLSDGLITFDDFQIMYIFLEFKEKTVKTKVIKKAKKVGN